MLCRAGRHVLCCEVFGFSLVMALLWLDEYLDLPHCLFGAPATPVNWQESLIESVLILLLGVMVVFVSHKLLLHIRSMEGFLHVCAECHRVRPDGGDVLDAGQWESLDCYVDRNSNARLTHGLCPDCLKRLHPATYDRLRREQPDAKDGV